jgi:hypothetical protein
MEQISFRIFQIQSCFLSILFINLIIIDEIFQIPHIDFTYFSIFQSLSLTHSPPPPHLVACVLF